jgi:alpha-1,4-digalacturonate transport system substrate-binding protein
MNKRLTLLLMLAALALSLPAVHAQSPVELHIAWYDDGNEGGVLRAHLDGFQAKNPDIVVIMDTLDYAEGIQKALPQQIQAGEGPDMARLAAFTNLTPYYLNMRVLVQDADYWDRSFPPFVMQAMRPAGDTTGLYGFPNQFAVTGPFINRTLFEQAGIEVPSDSGAAVTWQAWTDAARRVAEATGTPYAIAIDRSGQRVAGAAISQGATFFAPDGSVTIDSPGFRDFANLLIGWHRDGITPADVWVDSSGGDTAPATTAADDFINGQLVFYMSGSWQIANFAQSIGDRFDWEAVPNPTGPGGSAGMPDSASVIVALKETQHPTEVARVMDYLAQRDVQADFAARTLFIPGDLGLAAEGVDYQTKLDSARQSLNTFLAQLPNLTEQAYRMRFYPQNAAIYNAIRNRLGQALAGDMALDDAITRMQQDVDATLAAAVG